MFFSVFLEVVEAVPGQTVLRLIDYFCRILSNEPNHLEVL